MVTEATDSVEKTTTDNVHFMRYVQLNILATNKTRRIEPNMCQTTENVRCVLWVVCCGLCVVGCGFCDMVTVCPNKVENPTKSDPEPSEIGATSMNIWSRDVVGPFWVVGGAKVPGRSGSFAG